MGAREALFNAVSRGCLAVPGLRAVFGGLYTAARKRGALAPLWRELEGTFGRAKSGVVFDAGSGIASARAFPHTTVHLFEAHPTVADIARRRVRAAG